MGNGTGKVTQQYPPNSIGKSAIVPNYFVRYILTPSNILNIMNEQAKSSSGIIRLRRV